MSYYSGSSMDQTYVDPDKIAMAEEQLDAMAGLFNRITDACYQKCIIPDKTKLNEADESCIENCVAKYLQADTKVRSTTQQMEANRQQQQQ